MPAVFPPIRFVAHLDTIDDEIQLVTCTGELDLASADALKATVARTTGQLLVIDLTGVPFMDSTGVGVLLAARRRYPAGRLSVCCPQGVAYRVLQVMRMLELLLVRGTLDQALATLTVHRRSPTVRVTPPRGSRASEPAI